MREYAIFIRAMNNVSRISSYSESEEYRFNNYIRCDSRQKIIYWTIYYEKFEDVHRKNNWFIKMWRGDCKMYLTINLVQATIRKISNFFY